MGLCVQSDTGTEIQIKAVQGWQNTVIHELVHAYNSGIGERKTRRLTRQVIANLKGLPVPLDADASDADLAKLATWKKWAGGTP